MKKIAIFILLLIFASCSTTKTPLQNMTGFDYEGHRGCRGLFPENTIAAMLKAVDLNVTTLEMDACVTKDKVVVLSHEPFFNSEISTKPDDTPVRPEEEKQLNIYQMDYAEVAKYDVGSRGNARFPQQQKTNAIKPKLSDVFVTVKNHCAAQSKPIPYFNIETKTQPESDNLYHPAPEEFVDLIMAEVKAAGVEDKTIIQSFDFRTLQYLHKKHPTIKTAMLIEADDNRSLRKQVEDLGFVPTIYSPAKELVNANLVKTCKEKGMRLVPWTVNDLSTIQKFIKLGVDGIISDYPNLFNVK